MTKENLLQYKNLLEEIEKRCEAFLSAEFHVTGFEIDDTHISIWGEDDHREPFTDYAEVTLEDFSSELVYNAKLKKREEEAAKLRKKKEENLSKVQKEKEAEERAEYTRLHKKYGGTIAQ